MNYYVPWLSCGVEIAFARLALCACYKKRPVSECVLDGALDVSVYVASLPNLLACS